MEANTAAELGLNQQNYTFPNNITSPYSPPLTVGHAIFASELDNQGLQTGAGVEASRVSETDDEDAHWDFTE